MEITVASNSPLGQYLAELDTEADGGESMAQLLSARRPVASRKCPRRSGSVSRDWSFRQLIQRLRRQIELMAIRNVIPELCAFHPTIREELQMTGSDAALSVVLSKSHESWWTMGKVLSGVEMVDEVRRVTAAVGGALVVIVAVVDGKSGGEFLLQTVWWVVVAATLALLGLELCVRMVLAWYARRSRQLASSLNDFVAALAKFNEVYADSLTLVKRAELASRGYRLGAGLLPPIGRLEDNNADAADDDDSKESAAMSAAKNQLRCIPLRRKLRTLNDQLQARASALIQSGEETTCEAHDLVEKDFVDEQAPSLLLTALAKQHNRSVLLLENAVRTLLIQTLAGVCSSRDNNVSSSLFRQLSSQRIAVKQLIEALSAWSDELEMWNITRNPVALPTSVSGRASSDRLQQDQQIFSNVRDPRLKSVATQLQDLRSMTETLTALVIAAQHDLLLSNSAVERLSSSGGAMRSMIQQLQEAWGNFDNAVSVLTGEENVSHNTDKSEVGKEDHEAEPISVLGSSVVPAPEDPNCTFIFTGTSTGDEGFDLQALLKQQEVDAATTASGPTPHFVHELRDVLTHRQAHAHPGLTKRVDHDPPAQLTTEAPPPPPAADAMFALPRAPPRGRPRRPPPNSGALPADSTSSDKASSASPTDRRVSSPAPNAFNLELLALLQRAQPSQQQDVTEYLDDSNDESEVDAESRCQ